MNRTIKFRGHEFFSKQFIYAQTIRETDDGWDFWTGEDWSHCTDCAQLIGVDKDGREVYEGDTLILPNGEEYEACFSGNVDARARIKEAQS